MGVLLSAPSPERVQWFASQFVGRDYENTVRHRIGDVDNSKVATATRLTDRDAGAFAACSVLAGSFENLLDFRFRDVVQANVRLPGFGIEIEAQVHGKKSITISAGRCPARPGKANQFRYEGLIEGD